MKILYYITSMIALLCAVALVGVGIAMLSDIKPHNAPFVALLWVSGIICLWAGFIAANLGQEAEEEDLDCATTTRY